MKTNVLYNELVLYNEHSVGQWSTSKSIYRQPPPLFELQRVGRTPRLVPSAVEGASRVTCFSPNGVAEDSLGRQPQESAIGIDENFLNLSSTDSQAVQ
jgi:hypothetical protein